METKKTITILGKELTIEQTYETFNQGGLTELHETIDLARLEDLISEEGDADSLVDDMVEYVYNEVYNQCSEDAKKGDALYAYRTLRIFFKEGGHVSASALYGESIESGSVEFYAYATDMEKEIEDEDGEEIEENVKHNELVEAIDRKAFSRKMTERESGDFEQLEEEARENYKRIHPEEFDEE